MRGDTSLEMERFRAAGTLALRRKEDRQGEMVAGVGLKPTTRGFSNGSERRK